MSSAENFLPIQSLDIEAESKITFNLYVNLPLNNRYILYRRAGGQVELERLEKLTRGSVSNFYIEKKDYNTFVNYVAQRLCSLVRPGEGDNRLAMQTAARAILSSTLDQNDPSIATVMMANLKDITGMIIENTFVNVDSQSRKLFHRLASLSEKGTDFQKHPVNVASLAVLMTYGIGYSREQILTDVAMAGLLHDVGLSQVPPTVATLAHDVLKLQIRDRELIYKHPILAVEFLEEKKIPLSTLAKTIILQHHEEFNGNGYPYGIRGYMINELSQILRVADEIDLIFSQMTTNSSPLKIQVAEMLRRFSDQKVVEPLLLSRIRKVLI